MSKLPNNKKIILTNIPGTHDSAAFNMNYFGSVFAKCQDLNIMEQLKEGTRIFDIRVTINQCFFSCGINQPIEEYDLDLICCHGICDCYFINDIGNKINLTFKDVLLDIKRFLEENPTETIIFNVNSGRGNKFNNIKRANDIYEKIVGDISINYNKDLIIGDCRGKIININYKTNERDEEGRTLYNIDEGGFGLEEIHKNFAPDPNYHIFKVDGNLKIKEVEKFMKTNEITFEEAEKDFEKNKAKYPFSYAISCTGEYEKIIPLPKTQADIANQFILNYNLKAGNYYGWINIDFLDKNIAKKIIDTNFS